MLRYRLLRSLLMAAVVMVAIPQAANAQAYSSRLWSFDFGGGYTLPLGSLSDVSSGGFGFTVGANYFVSDLLGLRVETGGDFLSGKDDDLLISNPLVNGEPGAPNLRFYHILGGLDFDFVDPADPDNSFRFQLFLLGGAAIVNSDKFAAPPSPTFPNGLVNGSWQDAYPEFRGGIRLGFALGDCAPQRARVCGELFFTGGSHIMFANEEDTAAIASLYRGASPFGTAITLPLTLGIRLNVR